MEAAHDETPEQRQARHEDLKLKLSLPSNQTIEQKTLITLERILVIAEDLQARFMQPQQQQIEIAIEHKKALLEQAKAAQAAHSDDPPFKPAPKGKGRR